MDVSDGGKPASGGRASGERPPKKEVGERSAGPQEAGRSEASRPAEIHRARPDRPEGSFEPTDAGEREERWSVGKKTQVVLRLLRGEDLDTVSREVGVTVPELVEWRDDFLRGGREALKTRPGDPLEKKLQEALAKIGDLTMRLELWEKRGSRLALPRRSEP